jgi:hypothetical protein
VLGAVAVSVAGALVVGVVVHQGRGEDAARSRRWERSAATATKPAQAAVVDLIQLASAWRGEPSPLGTVSDDQVRANLGGIQASFRDANDGLNQLPPDPRTGEALAELRGAIRLYTESAALLGAATLVPRGPLRDQVLQSVTRVRFLGDRIYALGRTDQSVPPLTDDPRLHFDPGPPVPDWRTMAVSDKCLDIGRCPSLAPGSPLEQPERLRARENPGDKPAQAFSAWTAAVAAIGIPSGSTEARAIGDGSAASASRVARALTDAQRAVGTLAPPSADGLSERLQLALLVHAEAVRSIQAADLVGGQASAALRGIGELLARTGDSVWPTTAGARLTGLAEERSTVEGDWYPRI